MVLGGSQIVLGALALIGFPLGSEAFVPRASTAGVGTLCRPRWSSETVRPSQTMARTEQVLVQSQSPAPESDFESLPWSRSITGEGKDALLYMPFVEHQLRHIGELGGAREVPMAPHIRYCSSSHHAAHIGSACFENEDFRRIRMTYVDAGKAVQVFNSVWYPRLDCDAPILGVDLLCFGGGHRLLAVVDFQPLSQSAEYKERYTDQLAPIRGKYPALCETISNRYYEDTRWFSDQMLFGRLGTEEEIWATLMPAFREYMSAYTSTVRRAREEGSKVGVEEVLNKHREYDQYNMERDPAGKLFDSYFGKEWSHEYMSSFLFDTVHSS